MKPLRIALVLAFVGISAGIIWCLCMSAPAKVLLPGGAEMRILKVSLGGTHVLSFEPIWKRFLRRVFPEALQKSILGPFQGRYVYTVGEALAVWVDAPGPSAGSPFSVDRAEAVFTNGVIAGKTLSGKAGTYCLIFNCFARESRMVPLRVKYEGRAIDFKVKNPRPAEGARWVSLPLPQTQTVGKLSVALNRLRPRSSASGGAPECEAFLSARGDGAGWTWWRVTALDSWGNYQTGDFGWNGPPRFPTLPVGRGPWRLQVQGVEFISVGRIDYPMADSFVVLPMKQRFADLGIRFLLLANAGRYTVTNGTDTVTVQSVSSAMIKPLTFTRSSSTTNWALRLSSARPGVLCVSDLVPGLPRPQIRLHERDERNQGRTYGCKSFVATNNVGGVKHLAQFFLLPPLPYDWAKQPEVEVTSELSTDFFVNAPEGN